MELKPCPFCEGKAIVQKFPHGYRINCTTIECDIIHPSVGLFTSEEIAISLWNTRPIEEELRSALKICLRQLQRAINGDTLDGDWIQAELQARMLLE